MRCSITPAWLFWRFYGRLESFWHGSTWRNLKGFHLLTPCLPSYLETLYAVHASPCSVAKWIPIDLGRFLFGMWMCWGETFQPLAWPLSTPSTVAMGPLSMYGVRHPHSQKNRNPLSVGSFHQFSQTHRTLQSSTTTWGFWNMACHVPALLVCVCYASHLGSLLFLPSFQMSSFSSPFRFHSCSNHPPSRPNEVLAFCILIHLVSHCIILPCLIHSSIHCPHPHPQELGCVTLWNSSSALLVPCSCLQNEWMGGRKERRKGERRKEGSKEGRERVRKWVNDFAKWRP